MNHIIYRGIFLILLLIPLSSYAVVCPVDDGVYLCKNEDHCDVEDASDCVNLVYDVDDLDDIGYGDEVGCLCVNAYTSVVIYEDDDFNEDEYEIFSASSSDYIIKQSNDFNEIDVDSIKVHPRDIIDCDSGEDIDDCLMEAAKPTLIYDEGTTDCNDRFHEGEDGFRSEVQTTDDGQYKVVFYEIYHKNDCGVSIAGFTFDSHEGDGEVVRVAFQKINDGAEIFWAFVAASFEHHGDEGHLCTTEKQLEELTWPLRVYLSEGKHGQYSSEWECDNWDTGDAADCIDAAGLVDFLADLGSIYNYEDCDDWKWEDTWESDDLGTVPTEGGNGGEILYPEEYSLVDGSVSDDIDTDWIDSIQGALDISDTNDWFNEVEITLDEAGLVVLQPAEEEEPVDNTNDYTVVSDEDIYVYYSDTTLENFIIESSGDMTVSSLGDLTLAHFIVEGGTLEAAAIFDSLALTDFTLESGSYGVFVGDVITADDFTVDSGTTVYMGADRVILSPDFHVQRGAEFYVFSSL